MIRYTKHECVRLLLIAAMRSYYGSYCLILRINRERIGETDYGIVIEWLWAGETKLTDSWKG